ncbi:MAG: hypothetical protein ACKVH8_00760 [Pirellulales bacterium]
MNKRSSQSLGTQPPPFQDPSLSAEFSNQVTHGFHGEIEPTKPSFLYILSMGIVSLVMVLLPILYLAWRIQF